MAQSCIEPLLAKTGAASRILPYARLVDIKTAHSQSASDVVIVGAGLAGTLIALVLARKGIRVTIIDRHSVYPREFRCEKLSPAQLAMMRELGVLDCLSNVTQTFNHILVIRGGRSAAIQQQEERGLAYSDMVNRFRDMWPPNVSFIEGCVVQIETNTECQRVTLADGPIIDARLAVLATGLSSKLHAALGLKRRVIRQAHSFCLGFNVASSNGVPFPFQSMTYFGENAGDRIGYATFFPVERGMRVNLFSYHDKQEAWIGSIHQDPIGKLREVMPSIVKHLGDFKVVTPIEIRRIDLYETRNHRRDGLVLVGDALRSSCPATGSGVTRLLTDVRQLCLVHLPRWFETPGMEAHKIDSFYRDPRKRRVDRSSACAAERSRYLAVETSLRWRIERKLLIFSNRFPFLRKLASHWRGTPSVKWTTIGSPESHLDPAINARLDASSHPEPRSKRS